MRQVRNGCGVPQVHVDPQKGRARGARLFVRGGVCPLDAPAQGLLLCAPARACGRFGPGARGYLGALRAPVGACRRCGGHRVTFSAESAGVWEVGGRRPRVEMAEPEVVPPLSEGVPDLQQAGVDAAPVVLAKRLPLDLLPPVAGEDPVVVGAVRTSCQESGLRYASKTNYRTENYQLARHILEMDWRPFR